jgi:serine/threonine protein kinase
MRQFAHYTLIQRVGIGGMGEVWMAQRPLLTSSKIVALKIMSPKIYADEKYRSLFFEEARIATTLGNSCIVQAHHAGVHEGVCYLEMEWVDGVDLAKLNRWLWQSQQKLPLHVGIHIIGEILRGLEFAHEHEVIHRDISPQNVMLSLAGEVKITDFGVAKLMTEETTGEDFKGKLTYAGPERIINPAEFGSDPRIDVFAVGAIFEEIVTGRRFRENLDTFEGLISAIRNMAPPPPLPATVLPAPLDEFRRHLLSPDPQRRATNARSALAMLRTWPGFRDARTDLRQFVRAYQAQLPQQPIHESENATDSAGSRPEQLTWTNQSTSKSSNDEITMANSLPDLEQPRMHLHQWIALALAALGSCIGSCGVGAAFVLARTSELSAPPVPIQSSPSVTPLEPPRTPVAEPEHEPPPEPEPVPKLELELEPTIPPESTSAAPDEPTTPKPTKACAPVPVTISSGPYLFAWIKVGGKEYLLEPDAEVMLPCNRRHSVQMRLSEDEDWTKLGHVEVEANKRYRVKLQKQTPRLAITVSEG